MNSLAELNDGKLLLDPNIMLLVEDENTTYRTGGCRADRIKVCHTPGERMYLCAFHRPDRIAECQALA